MSSNIFVGDLDIKHVKQVRPDYGYFESRWKSFPYWFDVTVSGYMAEAGFFYDELLDAIECFCCRQSVQSWRNITHSHSKPLSHPHAPDCRFIRRGETSDLPPNLPKAIANRSLDSNDSDSGLLKAKVGKTERVLGNTVYFKTGSTSDRPLRYCDICNCRGHLVAFYCGHQYSCEDCASLIDICLLCNKHLSLK